MKNLHSEYTSKKIRGREKNICGRKKTFVDEKKTFVDGLFNSKNYFK
ncbi:MAG: hypothetical protein JST20_00270 [Bacteroidetes bacterium]|nr:hypothetical protein [Bacteroidota bacterium]